MVVDTVSRPLASIVADRLLACSLVLSWSSVLTLPLVPSPKVTLTAVPPLKEEKVKVYHKIIKNCEPVGSFVNEKITTVNFLFTHEDTEVGNKVGRLDPGTGEIKWSRSVGTPWPVSAISCGDLVPNIGITSAPVYDSATDSVYFTAKVNDGVDVNHPHYYLHAVDPATGTERSGWPVTIQGSPSNDTSTPFNAKTVLQRPGRENITRFGS